MANGNRNLALSIIIGAKDRASQALGTLGRGLKSLDNTATRLGGTLAGLFGAYKLTQFFKSALGGARDLEAQLSRVQAATGATAEEMDTLRAAAEEMGANTRYTATQAAEGLEILGRAGLSAAESVKALPTVLQLAQADGMDLATAAGIITDSLGAMNEKVDEAGRFADVLAQGARLANTDVSKLGFALSYAGVQAGQMGMDVEQTVAVLDALANAGIRGERAGTALRNILSQLADPASKARDELRELGIDTSDLVTVIGGLERAGPAAEAAILAFGTEAGPALRTLLQAGREGIAEYEEALRNATGTAKEMADAMDDNLDGALRGLGSAWDALKTKLVDPLLEPITEEVQALTQRIREFTDGEALKQFSASLVTAFKDGAAAAREWAAQVDFTEVTQKLAQFTEDSITRLGAFTRILQATAGGARLFFNTFSAGVNAVGALLAKTLESAAYWAEQFARLGNKIGVISEQAVGEISLVRESLKQASEAYVDAVIEDSEDIEAAWADIIDAFEKTGRSHRQLADEAERSSERQVVASENMADAINAAHPALDRLAEKLQEAGDPTAIQGLRAELDRLYERGEMGAASYAQGLEMLSQRSREMREQVTEGTSVLEQAGITFGRTAQNADELDAALKKVGISIKEEISPEDIKAAETALRQLWQSGKISAEQYQAKLAELRGETQQVGDDAEEMAERAQAAAERFRTAFDEALREATDGNDIVRLRQQLEDAWRAGTISAEEYRERLKDIRAATKALAEETSAAGNLVASVFNATAASVAKLSKAAHNYFLDLMGMAGGVGDELAGLQQRLDGVNQRIAENRAYVINLAGGIGTYLEKIADAGYQAEQAFLKQAIAAETLRQRVEGGRLSVEELERAAYRAERGFDLLDQQQLTGLRSAIAAAQRDAQQLTESLEQQVSSLRDELDQLRGDEEAIEQRRFDRQRQEIEEQLALAQAQGNREAAQEAQEALRLLQQIQSERREQQRQQQAQQRQQQTQPTTPTPAPARAAAPPTQRIELVGPGGQVVAGEFDEGSAAALLQLLEDAGMRANQ